MREPLPPLPPSGDVNILPRRKSASVFLVLTGRCRWLMNPKSPPPPAPLVSAITAAASLL